MTTTKHYTKQRSIMYTQQLDRIVLEDWEAEIDRIVKATEPLYWAGIVHDKDLNDKGEPVAPHLHLMLYFKHARSPQNVAWEIQGKTGKREDAQIERLEFFKRPNNGYSYLVHRTENAKDKYQYPIEAVKSNFDFAKKIDQITRSVERSQATKDNDLIAEYLDLLYTGDISLDMIEEELTGSLYAKASHRLKTVAEKQQAFLAKDFIKQMTATNQHKQVIYLYGEAGYGKTRLAKHYAQSLGVPYFITGSSLDPFQAYRNQPTVIIDELRATTFRYADLLKLLDPYNFDVMIPSRYQDKALTANMIFITSPYSPRQLYDALFPDRSIDSFYQLERRLDTVILVDRDKLHLMAYDKEQASYHPVPHHSLDNPFPPQDEATKPSTFFDNLSTLLGDTPHDTNN